MTKNNLAFFAKELGKALAYAVLGHQSARKFEVTVFDCFVKRMYNGGKKLLGVFRKPPVTKTGGK